MKKIIFGALAVVAVGGIWYYNSADTPLINESVSDATTPSSAASAMTFAESATPSKTSSAQEKPAEEAAVPAAVKERLDAIHQRRPDLNIDAATLEAKMAQPYAWKNSDTVPKNLPLKPEELTDGRRFIAVDSLKIETLMPGDTLDLNVPETNNTHEAVIDSVEKFDYDTISWYGHINGSDGQTYSVSFTHGNNLTMGGFDSPDGHYVIQGHGADGWIASSGLLFKEHVDPIRPEDADKPPEAQVNTQTH